MIPTVKESTVFYSWYVASSFSDFYMKKLMVALFFVVFDMATGCREGLLVQIVMKYKDPQIQNPPPGLPKAEYNNLTVSP